MVSSLSERIARALSKSIVGALVVAQVFGGATFAEAPRFRYLTIRGDTLSDIVWATVPGRLYGPGGNLERVLKLNPHLENPDHIVPGEVVLLPDGSKFLVETLSETNPKNNTHRDRQIASVEQSSSPQTVPVVNPTPIGAKSAEPEPPLPSQKSEFSRGARLELSPFYRMNAITLTDPTTGAKSTVGSKLYTGVNIDYIQAWTKKIQSYVHLNLGFISFEPPSDSTKTIQHSDRLLSGLGVGARYRLVDSLEFDLLATYQKELFGRSLSTTSVAMDAVSVPSLRLQSNWDLVNLDPFVFGVAPIIQVYFSTQGDSYPIRQGKALGGTLYFKQSVSGNEPNFQTEVGVLSRTQNSAQIEQNELSFFLNLRFFFDIGRKQKAREAEE